MLTHEDGPVWVFRRLRNLPPPKSSLRQGIRCIWCSSVWMSALVTVMLYLLGVVSFPWMVFYWLSISGGAIGLNQWVIVRFNKQ